MRLLIDLEKDPDVNFTNKIYEFISPNYIYIPVIKSDHYKINDYIYKNSVIGDFTASISGKICGLKKVFYNGKMYPALKIKNDYQENVLNKKRKRTINNKEELINLLEKFNLNNLKDKLNSDFDKIIITSIDEEIYSLKEFMLLSNYYNEILDTIEILLNVYNIKKTLLVTKNTDSLSIKNVKSIIGTYPSIKIKLVDDKYLISYPEILCENLNIKLEKALILKGSEIYEIYNALMGKYMCETLVSLSGNALKKSLVANIKIGTSLKEIDLEFKDSVYDIYLNGYLSGIKYNNLEDIIITKDIHTIVFNKKEEIEETECINCGACLKVCPHNIYVKEHYFKKNKSSKCIGCGLCNYICPARLKLKEVVMSGDNEKEKD